MLACAACAWEKQHLLGQLLKEMEIHLSENAMPNTGCQDKFQVNRTHHTEGYKDMKFFGE